MGTVALFVLALAPALWAQAPAVLRGTLVECDLEGQFSVRAADHRVFRFSFDRQTYFERDNRRAEARQLVLGDALEVVSEQTADSLLRYARTVHVLAPETPRPPARRRWPLYTSRLDSLIPRGDTTYSGVVVRVTEDRVVLRLRDAKQVSLALREDTRFLDSGNPVDRAELKTTMRVFVRAGKNLYNEPEAYQVMWGTILDPTRK